MLEPIGRICECGCLPSEHNWNLPDAPCESAACMGGQQDLHCKNYDPAVEGSYCHAYRERVHPAVYFYFAQVSAARAEYRTAIAAVTVEQAERLIKAWRKLKWLEEDSEAFNH